MPSLADMEGLLFHGITTFVTPLPTSAAEPTIQCRHGLSPNHSNSRPADILVQGWERGLPAAFNVTVSSPLTPASLEEASASTGAAARIAETREHSANDSKCQELGWSMYLTGCRILWQLGGEGSFCFQTLGLPNCHPSVMPKGLSVSRTLWSPQLVFSEVSSKSHIGKGAHGSCG